MANAKTEKKGEVKNKEDAANVHRPDLWMIAGSLVKIKEYRETLLKEMVFFSEMFEKKRSGSRSAKEIVSYMKECIGEKERTIFPLVLFFNDYLSEDTISKMTEAIKREDPVFYKELVSLGLREP